MCTSKLTVKRFRKMYLEVKFYRIAIFLLLLLAGYEKLGARSLFIPFYNQLIENWIEEI